MEGHFTIRLIMLVGMAAGGTMFYFGGAWYLAGFVSAGLMFTFVAGLREMRAAGETP